MLQCFDNFIEIEHDTKMFKGKRVMECGFATGLLSAFAMSNGASSAALHCIDPTALECHIRPTLRRNNIPRSKLKFSSGGLEGCKQAISGQKYDIIMAPEILNCDEETFEAIHDLLDSALSSDGIM